MKSIPFALDVILEPLPEEISTAISESPAPLDSLSGFLLPAAALVLIAAVAIIFFTLRKKHDK